MKNSLPTIAFFSIIFLLVACIALPLFGHDAYAQSVTASPSATTHGVQPVGVPTPPAIAPAQIQPVGELQPLTPQVTQQIASQIPLNANITLVSPKGGETFVNGNRTPISWHANIPEIPDAYRQRGYKLMGELRLIDQSQNKKDLRIAFLTEQDLAKGTYQFLPGSQTEMTYGHTAATEGQYKVWIDIKGVYDCGPNAKCAPLFEAQAITASPVTIKYH